MKENNLICAVFHNDINYVRKNLGNYNDIKHITDPFGNTVFHIAAKMGYREMFELLLEGKNESDQLGILDFRNNKSITVCSLIPENFQDIHVVKTYIEAKKMGLY
ncbi:MAG: ankyrin repeat domain-containing protein [Bacteroidales bacterium]|nr:ankyrin repeat domain-containing protein [Bacteroidales bacterium]